MARYNGLIIPRSYNDYYSRSDPQAILDLVVLAADGELNAESKNPLQNQAIAKIVPATASPENKLAVETALKKYNYANATALNSSDDFNNIKSEGYYYCNGDNMPSNYPSGIELVYLQNFILHVYPQGDTGRIVQEFTTINGKRKYIRFYSLVSWSEWGKIITDKDNGNDRSIKIPKNGTVVTSIKVNSGNEQRIGFLLLIEGNISGENNTYCELYLIRVGYSGNHHTEILIHSDGNKGNNKHTFGISDDGYLTISASIESRYYIF